MALKAFLDYLFQYSFWKIWLIVIIVLMILSVILVLYKGYWENLKNREQSAVPELEGEMEQFQKKESGFERSSSEFECVSAQAGENKLISDMEKSNLSLNEEEINSTTKAIAPVITIKKRNNYQPEQLLEPMQLDKKEFVFTSNSDYHLIFTASAFQKLKMALDWNQRTKRNIIEQGGVLIGAAYHCQNQLYCVADDIILARTAGNSSFVEFTPSCWSEMQDKLDELNCEREKKGVIIGWFHTHPNGLPVFMSGTDMGTQRKNFPESWQVSLVLNPHKMIFKSFFGYDATVGSIIIRKE